MSISQFFDCKMRCVCLWTGKGGGGKHKKGLNHQDSHVVRGIVKTVIPQLCCLQSTENHHSRKMFVKTEDYRRYITQSQDYVLFFLYTWLSSVGKSSPPKILRNAAFWSINTCYFFRILNLSFCGVKLIIMTLFFYKYRVLFLLMDRQYVLKNLSIKIGL